MPKPEDGALLLRGGRLVDPAAGIDGIRDLRLEGGRVSAVGERLPDQGARVLDVTGLVVAPGFIDMHVHLREPGREEAETIASGLAAAVAGGFTAVAAMPNTEPVNDDASVTRYILFEAARHGLARVHPIGCVTRGMEGEQLAEIGDLVRAGCVGVSDDGRPVSSALVMRRALEYSTLFGIPVIDHCEERTLTEGGVMNEGAVATRLGLRGMPAAAEDLMVERDIRLARLTGGRVHIAHVSTRGAVEAIRRGKAEGVAVTAEVAPHHLLLTDEAVSGYDTHCRMNPPLREEVDRQACLAALLDGTLDAIATDHAPHPPHTKNVEFDAAPNGVTGLETAVSVLLDRLVGSGALPLGRLVEAFTAAPARILRLEGQGTLAAGARADVTVLDPALTRRLDPERFRSRSRNTPFAGWTCRGAAVLTLVGGRVVYDGRAAGSAADAAT